MKRITGSLLLAIALLATVSCATYNGNAMQSVGEVAVVSIQCRRLIDTSAEDSWKGVAKSWAKSESLDLSFAALRITTDVFGSYARSLPFTLIGEQALLNSEAYQGLGDGAIKMLPAKDFTLPSGYHALPLNSRAAVKELIARLPDADGFLWAEVAYSLVKKGSFKGFDFMTLRADLTVTVLDRRGRGMLRHTEIAEDEKEFRVGGLAMVRTEEIVAAVVRATERASTQMSRWLAAKGAR